jgi:hypothetical protein
MKPNRIAIAKGAAALLVVAGLVWLIVATIRSARPYTVDAAALSHWTLVAGEPGGAVLVALEPSAALANGLFEQLAQRTRQTIFAVPSPVIPLVLQGEYEDSLQGVFSVGDIMNLARDAGVESASFEPVCLGERTETRAGKDVHLFFVRFEADAFYDFRQQLSPLFPEHGGNSYFDPAALHPTLTFAATDREAVRPSAGALERRSECRTAVRVD